MFGLTALLLALPAAARTRPRYGDTLRVEVSGDPWERPGGLARRLVFDGLTQMAPDGELEPALAISWASENNDHRWQFRLRPGVHFHDGSSVTTTAVVASLMASCTANCPWDSVRALATSIVFTSDEAMPQLPQLLAGSEFLIAKGAGADPDGGTGAFEVSGFANGTLTLAANDSSWAGRPFVDAIEIRVNRAVNDQWIDLAAGRTDVAEVPAESIRGAQQQHLNLALAPQAEVLALQLSDRGALANANLRAAIGYAIDRNAIANVIFQKQGKISAALLPQSVSGYAFLFSAERDLNKAHELRGGMTPAPLVLTAGADAALQLTAQRIILNLREAGFNVQLAGPAVRAADMRLRTFAMQGADAAGDLVSVALASGLAVPAMGAGPSSTYNAERELLEHRTLIPLVHLPRAWAVSGRVRDLQLRYDGSPVLEGVSLEAAK
ncbi:MAG TPA: ABC transporter substrate-binding protein [Terracidiphilus sp.]